MGALYERGAELSELEAAVQAARDGHGSLQAIVGAAGIGKTSLLQATCRSARSAGLTVLTARAGELERDFSFGVVRDLLGPGVRDPADRDRLLAGAAGLALPALGLRDSPAVGIEIEAAAAIPGERFAALAYGLYWLTVNLAETGPLVLAVDDLHWADELSLRWLGYLARRLEELPVLVVVAARSGEPAEPGSVLATLLAPPAATVLTPAPLTVDGAGALLSTVLEAELGASLTEACHTATGGNPFLLRSLAEALREDQHDLGDALAARIDEVTPASVRAAVASRIGRLPAGAIAVARAVSVLGAEATQGRIGRLAGLAAGAAASATSDLVGVGVLADETRPRFVHPLVGAAVYADMLHAERARRHGEAAALLLDDGEDPERVAVHVRRAEPNGDPRAVSVLLAAARSALARGAAGAAVVSLRRALSEPPAPARRVEVLRELGAAEAQSGEPAGLDHLREAITLTSDARERATLRLELGRALMLGGRLTEAVTELDAGVTEIRDRDPELELRLQAELIGAARFDFSTRSIVAERLGDLRARARDDGPAERKLLANVAFEMMWAAVPIPEVVDQAVRALGGGRLLAEEGAASPVSGLPLWALVYCDRYDLAAPGIEALLAAARAQGSASGFTLACTLGAAAALRRGHLAEAETQARAALERVDAARIEQPLALGALLESLVEQDRCDEAQDSLRQAGLENDMPQFPIFAAPLWGRARLHLARGELQAGLDDALGVGRAGPNLGQPQQDLLPMARHGGDDPQPPRSCRRGSRACRRGCGRRRDVGPLRVLSGSSCAPPGCWRRARRIGWPCCGGRSTCWPTRRHDWITHARSRPSAVSCAGRAGARTRASRCAKRSISRIASVPWCSCARPARSWPQPARVPGGCGSRARSR